MYPRGQGAIGWFRAGKAREGGWVERRPKDLMEPNAENGSVGMTASCQAVDVYGS